MGVYCMGLKSDRRTLVLGGLKFTVGEVGAMSKGYDPVSDDLKSLKQ